MTEKRKRGQNFSLEDKDKLIKLLLIHKNTILNKKTDGATNEAKNEAWIAITNSFNSSSNTHRNKESLMKVWEKLKSESKTYKTKINRNATQTGGGPSTIKYDPVLEQVCSILGRGCTGILGVSDSDAETGPQAERALPKILCVTNEIWQSEKEVPKAEKETIEDLKEQLLREELVFKKKLYELQLQAAVKEVEIKTAILDHIKNGGFSLNNLYEHQQKND